MWGFVGSSCPYLTLNVVSYRLLWCISFLIILTSGFYHGFGSNFIIYDHSYFPTLILGTHISSHSPQALYLGKRGVIILILILHCVTHSQIFAQLECMVSVLSTLCPPIEASSIDRTQQR
jgi:hypothetical protein